MDRRQFERLLKDDGVSIRFRADGIEFSAEPQMSYFFDEAQGISEFKATGFELTSGGKTQSYQKIEELFENFVTKQVELISINDMYCSLEEYEEEKAFENIDMEDLLKIYLPIADSFSLNCPYNDGYDAEHRYGIYSISDELAKKAIDGLASVMEETSRKQYAQISEEERVKLPPFDRLYKEIGEECAAFRKKNSKKAEKFDGNVFFCDIFGTKKSKYKEPPELWHLYHAVDFVETCRFGLDKMKENAEQRSLLAELDGEEYGELKGSLIKTDVTFSWHCTTSGQLTKVFYFALNDGTVEWLKRHKNDYDFNKLQDLAFYRDGKCVFSSCTHEGYHTGAEKKLKR